MDSRHDELPAFRTQVLFAEPAKELRGGTTVGRIVDDAIGDRNSFPPRRPRSLLGDHDVVPQTTPDPPLVPRDRHNQAVVCHVCWSRQEETANGGGEVTRRKHRIYNLENLFKTKTVTNTGGLKHTMGCCSLFPGAIIGSPAKGIPPPPRQS